MIKDLQIIKVPGINNFEKDLGCERSGEEIIKNLKQIFANESGKKISVQELDLEEIHLDNKNLELTNKLIYENSFEAFEIKPKLIYLGGDHSISYSITRAFLDYCENNGKEPCLIIFDSCPNLMPYNQEKEKFPKSNQWLKGLIQDGFPIRNILLVGIRNSASQEEEFIQEKRIKLMGINQFLLNIEDSCDILMEFATGKELYVSLDLSVVDPVFAPATQFSVPGGLTSRQLIYLIQRINKIKTLKAVDIVEINKEKDKKFNGITIKLGAKILGELI